VLEAHGLAGGGVVDDLERGRLRAREDRQRVRLQLDFAGREVGVLVAAALDDDARDADAKFAAQLAGQAVGLGVGPRFEHHLGEATAIAEVDEDAAAVVAARRDPAEQDRALAGVAPAQPAAVMCSLEIDQELGHAGDFIRTAPVRESGWMSDRTLAHGDPSDMLIPSKKCGCASSITVTASMAAAPRACSRAFIANASPRARSRSCIGRWSTRGRRSRSRPTASTAMRTRASTFRYSQDPRLTWWFDHHASAFQLAGDEDHFRADATGRKFYDPTAKSCTKFLADTVAAKFGFDEAPLKELIEWAEIIDGALFPSAKMAVELKEPALQLMTFIENNRQPEPRTGSSAI
jgi:hypothetical protein